MELATVGTALGSLKAAFELMKVAVDTRDAVKFNEYRVELLKLIADAHSECLAVTLQKNELLKRVGELEAWKSEVERYQLTEIAPGAVAYKVKPSAQGHEPDHELCPNCFSDGRKRFLIRKKATSRNIEAVCQACQLTMPLTDIPQGPSSGPLRI